MNKETRKAILGVGGFLTVLIATYITKNANCLWAWIAVAAILKID